MSDRPTTTSILSRRKKILFSVVLLLLFLALAEVASHFLLKIFRGYDGKQLYQYAFDPYKNLLPAPGFVDTRGIRHNAQGFRRSSVVSLSKPAGTYRIFLMGASTAYGFGGLWTHIQRDYAVLNNSETIDAFLEQYIQEAFPEIQVEVINAAITSTWTHHHLIYLNQSILAYDPDMVLFLDGFNDFYFYNLDHDQFRSYWYSRRARLMMGQPTLYSLVYVNAWWLFRKSAFVHALARVGRSAKQLVSGRDDTTSVDVERALTGLREVFPKNALKMHRRSGLILKDEGVIPVFMLQPMLLLERGRPHMPQIEQQLFQFNVEISGPNQESFIHQAVEFVREQEQVMTDEIGGHFMDLTGIFADAEGQIFTDFAHLTPEGNAMLARYVAHRLIPLIGDDLAR